MGKPVNYIYFVVEISEFWHYSQSYEK